MRVVVCAQCGEWITDAQRSTRIYCSEACKQRAKRIRARIEQVVREGGDPCWHCGEPMYYTDRKGRRRRVTRMYCDENCRQTAKRIRRRERAAIAYRVGNPGSYRVSDLENPADGPGIEDSPRAITEEEPGPGLDEIGAELGLVRDPPEETARRAEREVTEASFNELLGEV